jgi:hypothetical protein
MIISLYAGSIDHYCDSPDMDPHFVILKHRQIWTDLLSNRDILEDAKHLAIYLDGELPTKRILLTV